MAVMVRNKFGILIPNTPVMKELAPRLPNELPVGFNLFALLLGTENGLALGTEYRQAIRTNLNYRTQKND